MSRTHKTRKVIVIKAKNRLGCFIYIILYIIASLFLFSFINYTGNYNFFIFYFFILGLNLILILPKKKDKKYLFFSFTLNIYCGLFYFITNYWSSFSKRNFTGKLSELLFGLFHVIISINWSLPIFYVLLSKQRKAN